MQIALKNNWREADLLRSQLIPAVSPSTWWIRNFRSREILFAPLPGLRPATAHGCLYVNEDVGHEFQTMRGLKVQNLPLAKYLLVLLPMSLCLQSSPKLPHRGLSPLPMGEAGILSIPHF